MNAESVEIINELLHTPWVKDIHFLKGEDEDNSDNDPLLKIDLADEQFSKQLHEKTKGMETDMIITVPDKDGRANREFAQLVRQHAQVRSELPELLSKLVALGRKDEALNLLVQWGTHVRANSEVWGEAKELLKEKSV